MSETLPDARRRLAGALGAAARRLWRRQDLSTDDEVVADLAAEALARLGRLLRPDSQRSLLATLELAPSGVRTELRLLAAVATPTHRRDTATSVRDGCPARRRRRKRTCAASVAAPVTPAATGPRSRSTTPPPLSPRGARPLPGTAVGPAMPLPSDRAEHPGHADCAAGVVVEACSVPLLERLEGKPGVSPRVDEGPTCPAASPTLAGSVGPRIPAGGPSTLVFVCEFDRLAGTACHPAKLCREGHTMAYTFNGQIDFECSQCGDDIGSDRALLFCAPCDYARCGSCMVEACRFRSYPMHLGSSNLAVENAVLATLLEDAVGGC